MRCEAFEQRMNQLLDERLAPELDSHLLAHAQGCPACQRLLSGQQQLLEGLQLGNPEGEHKWAPGFASEVVAAVLAADVTREDPALESPALESPALESPELESPELESPELESPELENSRPLQAHLGASSSPRSRGNSRGNSHGDFGPLRWLGPATVAAAVLLAVGIPVWLAYSAGSTSPLTATTRVGDSGGQPLAARADDGIIAPRQGSPALAVNPHELPDFDLEELAFWSTGEVDRLAGGLRPLTSSFSVAINAVRRTIPTRKLDESKQKQQKDKPSKNPYAFLLHGWV